jgi:hypothetical protein
LTAQSGICRDAAVVTALVGADVEVPLVAGGTQRYINFDYAASAACLVAVKQAVDALLPWYSSVDRGAGFKSQLATEAYEGARVAVRSFVQARPDDCVLFTRNTTDAINLLSSALPPSAAVVAFASGGCCIARSQSSREPQIEVGQIAITSSLKAAGTRRFTACSVPSS